MNTIRNEIERLTDAIPCMKRTADQCRESGDSYEQTLEMLVITLATRVSILENTLDSVYEFGIDVVEDGE